MTSLITNSEARTSTAMQALHDSSNRNADILFNMMAAIKTDLDERKPPALTDEKSFPPKVKALGPLLMIQGRILVARVIMPYQMEMLPPCDKRHT
jgi:hypothetical protein